MEENVALRSIGGNGQKHNVVKKHFSVTKRNYREVYKRRKDVLGNLTKKHHLNNKNNHERNREKATCKFPRSIKSKETTKAKGKRRLNFGKENCNNRFSA